MSANFILDKTTSIEWVLRLCNDSNTVDDDLLATKPSNSESWRQLKYFGFSAEQSRE
jgi:hypothetical protein